MEPGVLVGGCGSSGTTLLRELLNRHPEIYCGPEWYVFHHPWLYSAFGDLTASERELLLTSGFNELPRLRPGPMRWQKVVGKPVVITRFLDPRYREEAGLTPTVLSALAHQSDNFWNFAAGLFGTLAHHQGKTRWAEKTPVNCYAYAEFLGAHSGNRCLHLIRDGRDVAFSLMKRGFSINGAVDRWIADSSTGLAFEADPRLLVVRFEHLVEDPVAEMDRICRFIGAPLPDAEALLHPAGPNVRTERTGAAAAWDASPEGGVDRTMAGKWRNRAPEELAALKREFAREIAGQRGEDLLQLWQYPDW